MITRRTFLGAIGGAALAGTLLGCSLEERLEEGWPEEYEVKKPPVPGEKGWTLGEERYVNSLCFQCPAGCGIRVRVVEGRAVKIEGNPLYPTNQGGLCPKGQNGLQVLYDPDRIRSPMKRVGNRGEGKWQRISWNEAIKEVASRLKEIREQGNPNTFAIMSGHYSGHMHALIKRFLTVYGSPNEIRHDFAINAAKTAYYLTQGIKNYVTYDWENTNYLICFGTSFLEAGLPTTMHLRIYGYMRRGRPGKRVKIVQVDPRYSVTASKADEWLPIQPGTDAALALGIAHVIIRDNLYDPNFIQEHTFGFEDWQNPSGEEFIGFRRFVLEQYQPEKVSWITGVPKETIERIAHEFAENSPSIAISGRGISGQSNGIYNCMAIHCLNALAGSINAPGGVLLQRHPPFKEWWEPNLDEIAKKGLSMPRIDLAGSENYPLAESVYAKLPENILKKNPYELNALFLYFTNPLFSAPNVRQYYEAFQKIPFIVSFSPFLDESTHMADLILPDHTYLERWDDYQTPNSISHPFFGIRQPVVKPLYDTMHTGDVIIKIAKAIGGTVGNSFLNSYLKMVRYSIQGVASSGRGSILENNPKKFWNKLLKNGGWWDISYPFEDWQEVFKTPSGKFEFFSQIMKEKLEELAQNKAEREGIDQKEALNRILSQLRISSQGDKVYMSHYEPIRHIGGEEEYPFVLNTYKVMTHAEGRGGNQPHLQEIFGLQHNKKWEPWIEIHPEDANKLGIQNNQWVWVKSPLPIRKVRLKALIFEGTKPGVVNVPYEYGHTAYGRWAKGKGENLNQIIADECNYLNGSVAWCSTRVRLSKL